MKRIVLTFCAAVALAGSAAEAVKRPKVKLTPERRAAIQAKREQYVMRRYGGTIVNRTAQRGRVLFVNTQRRADLTPLTRVTERLERSLKSTIAVTNAAEVVTAENAGKTRARLGAEVAVFVVDSPALPTMLVAHEDNWAILNVAPLLADGPKAETFDKRLRQETYRTFGFLCGSGESVDARCVMQPLAGLKDLDALACDSYGFEAPIHLKKHLPVAGVTPYASYTYMDAVKRGIAPAPTNEYQRAIFENGGKPLAVTNAPAKK